LGSVAQGRRQWDDPYAQAVPDRHARFGSSSPWESRVGYSRTVRAGELVFVSGTTGTTPEGEVVAPGDVYEQARRAFTNVEAALAMAGAALADVVQTRMYVTDISRWDQVGRAHGEFFADVRPVTTMVEVAALIDPRMMIEVEAVAHLGRATDD
jgi:enamine deaminase RidA (YjgF/YER057c/UK114 family)